MAASEPGRHGGANGEWGPGGGGTLPGDGGIRLEFVDFGCKVNQAEGRELRARLASLGFRVSARWERPEVTVVNACAVTAVSEAKARKETARAKRRGSSLVVLTGCLAEVRREGWAGPFHPDLVVPQSEKQGLPEMLAERLRLPGPADRRGRPEGRRAKAKAFIKVQDGCGHPCTYCIVPLARGGPVSLPGKNILEEVRSCLEEGAGEIVLCGINLGAWRGEGGERLDGLVRSVLGLGEGFRVRLSSLDPEDLDNGLLEGLSGLERLCPHLHLPLQSGSDRVLKAMGRGYLAEEYLERVEMLRRRWDSPAVTTDVMVGFPGEEEEDFAATVELLEKVRPSRMHVFRYSPRPGTAAARLQGQVDEGVKRDRASRLACLGSELRREFARSQLGREAVLLAESLARGGGKEAAWGVTERYVRASLEGTGMEVGGLYRGVVAVEEGGVLGMRAGSGSPAAGAVGR